MGIGLDDTMLMPLCELLDLIAVNQIKMEGYRYREPKEKKSLMDILKVR